MRSAATIVEGGRADRTVFRLPACGLTSRVVDRSKTVLNTQNRNDTASGPAQPLGIDDEFSADRFQLSLFTPPPLPSAPSAIERDVLSADIDNMSPLQALNFLCIRPVSLEVLA